MLRKMFGLKTEEVAGGWRKLHNDGLHNLDCSPNIVKIKSRRMNWLEHVAHMGKVRNVYKLLVTKHKGKRPLERSRHGWEGTIEVNLHEVKCEYVNWIHLAKDIVQ
jgi:hypothetical protein